MMTMQTEFGGQGAHVGGQFGTPGGLWWGGNGSHGIHNGLSSAKATDCPDGEVLDAVKHVGLQLQQASRMQGMGQGLTEREEAQLGSKRVQVMATHSAYDQSNWNGTQNQQLTAGVISSAPSEFIYPHSQLELGHSFARASYPYTDPYCGGILTAYGAQAMIHPHMLGVATGSYCPCNLKQKKSQYMSTQNNIMAFLRRRQLRAKAELENKLVKVRKPYLHESRHLHAMRRARGCGGRFLNTKKLEGSKANTDNEKGSEGLTSTDWKFF
ncbi:hypothetical protein KI387_013587, partial [Taxus chinensis]